MQNVLFPIVPNTNLIRLETERMSANVLEKGYWTYKNSADLHIVNSE